MSGSFNLTANDHLPSASAPGAFSSSNSPGARLGASMTFSHDGRYLYLFGGSLRVQPGSAIPQPALMADLWVFSFSKMQWAYLSGPLTWAVQGSAHARSTVATAGAPSRLQAPGARAYASMTADADGLVYVGYGMRLPLTTGTTINDGTSADSLDESALEGTVFAVYAEQLHNSTWLPSATSITALVTAPTSHSIGSEVAAWAWLVNPNTVVITPYRSFTWASTSDDARLGASFLMLPNSLGTASETFASPSAVLLRTGGLTYATGAIIVGLTPVYPFYSHGKLTSGADQSALVALTTPCARNPCVNGGVCGIQPVSQTPVTLLVGLTSKSYRCTCPAGYFGEHCQTARAQFAPPTAPAVKALKCVATGTNQTNSLSAPCDCGTVRSSGTLCSPLTVRALVDNPYGSAQPGTVPRIFAASATTHSLSVTAAATLGLPAGSTVTFVAGGASNVNMLGMTAIVVANSLSARTSVTLVAEKTTDASTPVLETNFTAGTVAYTGQHMGASLVYFPQGNCLFLFGGIVSNGGTNVRTFISYFSRHMFSWNACVDLEHCTMYNLYVLSQPMI